MTGRTRLAIAIIAVCLALAASPLHALEVEEVRWGFDGQVVPYRFNVLSVLVSNPTPEPFDGMLHLRRTTGGLARVGATHVEPLFVSPFSQRWVQFYPYVMVDGPYELSWGRRRDEQFEIPAPRHGRPARVTVTDPSDVQQRAGALKAFPENLFPPTAVALDALEVVALDHVPRWQPPHRQALLDWVRSGGTVHVFQNGGRFPEFTAELAVLNAPVETQRISAGRVHRHTRSLADVDIEFLERVLLDRAPPASEETGNAQPAYNPYGDWNIDDNLFSALKTMTRPKHNWAIIHAMSITYLALIFPGMYFLGGRRADYRTVFAATLGLVALFSLGFSIVGRRGYDETTTVNSVAIARPLAEGAWDVTGRSNAFVTSGDFYTIQHAGVGRLYSTCQNLEAVNGRIHNGLEGQFYVDIPPYSSRTFGYRARVPGEPIHLTLESFRFSGPSIPPHWETTAAEEGMKTAPGDDAEPETATEERQAVTGLQELVIATGEGFPQDAHSIHAVFGNRIYALRQDDGRLVLSGPGQVITEFLPLDEYANHGGFGMYYDPWTGQYSGTPEETFHRLGTPLIGRALGLTNREQAIRFSLPEDRVRLFVYAPMPSEFFLKNEELGGQAGYVLYNIDLPLNTSEQDSAADRAR